MKRPSEMDFMLRIYFHILSINFCDMWAWTGLGSWALWLRLNYYTPKMRGHRQQWISNKMNIRHPGQLKKSKSCGPFWSYQLNSTANSAHSPQKWAKLAVLFSWQLQNGPQDFDFFNCHGCRLFILCEIHCYLCPRIFGI